MIAIILLSLSLIVRSDDLLQGKGTFNSTTLSEWTQLNSHNSNLSFTLQTDNSTQGGQYLQISKPSDSILNYQDGLQLNFSYYKINQISFYFDSTSVNMEDTNLRLLDFSLGTGKTALSFRCGFNGFVRVNENQVIAYYNNTIVNSSQYPIWTRADIFFDWNDQIVNVFLNQSYKGNAFFYDTTVQNGVDTILLYGLTPGSTGYFKNISVCTTFCDSFKSAQNLMISLGSLIMIASALFFI